VRLLVLPLTRPDQRIVLGSVTFCRMTTVGNSQSLPAHTHTFPPFFPSRTAHSAFPFLGGYDRRERAPNVNASSK